MTVKGTFSRLKRRFGHPLPDPVVNSGSREFEVNKWLLSEFIIHDLVPVVGVHPFPVDEILLMVAAVCRFRPRYIFEWGTNIGTSARIFHETVRRFQLESQIHSIDLPDTVDHVEHPRARRGLLVQGKKNVHLHQGDGLDVALRLSEHLSPAISLLFFLDGDHEYASVYREITGIIHNRPHAVILVHDTFDQSPESGYNVGPHQAVIKALQDVPRHYGVLSVKTGLPGMTLLYPSSTG